MRARILSTFFAPILALALLCAPASAQVRDSVFVDYASYDGFITQNINAREFETIIASLGGRNEYTPAQLGQAAQRLRAVFTERFENNTVFRREDLGGGVSQEGRMFWTGEGYLYYYAVLHKRQDTLVVLNFSINSSLPEIMALF